MTSARPPRRAVLVGALATLASGAAFAARAQADALTQAEFDDWVGAQRARALLAGVSADAWEAALQGLTPDPVVIARRASAAETNLTLADYVTRLLNGRGQKARAKLAATPQLAGVQARFGVPAGVLTAFWGMESDYGANIGDRDVLRATATHGAAGSGGADWSAEFLAGLKILQSGVVPRARLIGSYAGALGQTQLMPTNYLKYGVDFDGDGRIDVWASAPDALASAASHLVGETGWKPGQSWLEEVALAPGFDLSKTEVEITALPPDRWQALGAPRASGAPWSAADRAATARLLLPSGIKGPAFLAFANYSAFEAYNPSMPYAVGVSLLSKFAAGEVAIRKPWPTDPALPRETRMAAQAGLARLGYYEGKIDGDMGRKSRAALRAWQLSAGVPRDGFLTAEQAAVLAR